MGGISDVTEGPLFDRIKEWRNFLNTKCDDEFLFLSNNSHYPTFSLNYSDVLNWSDKLAEKTKNDPKNAILSLKEIIPELFRIKTGTELTTPVEIRFIGLKEREVSLRDIRSQLVNKLISIKGIIRSVSEVRPEMTYALFQCSNCGFRGGVYQDGEQLRQPGGGCIRCNGRKYEIILSRCTYRDSQNILIQEEPEGLDGVEQPKQIV